MCFTPTPPYGGSLEGASRQSPTHTQDALSSSTFPKLSRSCVALTFPFVFFAKDSDEVLLPPTTHSTFSRRSHYLTLYIRRMFSCSTFTLSKIHKSRHLLENSFYFDALAVVARKAIKIPYVKVKTVIFYPISEYMYM